MLQKLVIDEDEKALVRALVSQSSHESSFDDFVLGKGEKHGYILFKTSRLTINQAKA